MNEQYETYVMMDSENGVISEECETADEVLAEMRGKGYSRDAMHTLGFTLNKLLCNDHTWLECLEEIDY